MEVMDSVHAGAGDVTVPSRTTLEDFDVLVFSTMLPNCVSMRRGGRKDTRYEQDPDL